MDRNTVKIKLKEMFRINKIIVESFKIIISIKLILILNFILINKFLYFYISTFSNNNKQ